MFTGSKHKTHSKDCILIWQAGLLSGEIGCDKALDYLCCCRRERSAGREAAYLHPIEVNAVIVFGQLSERFKERMRL